jgi:hypothetical protein
MQYCEDAPDIPSPAFKRLRLDCEIAAGPGAGAHVAAAHAHAHALRAQQGLEDADAEAERRAVVALCSPGDYASINALLKQLHDERLRRAAAAGLAMPAPVGGGGDGPPHDR